MGIPGSVGGAVRSDAGGHGSETADWLISARVFDLKTAEFNQWTAADLNFSYRSSALASEHRSARRAEPNLAGISDRGSADGDGPGPAPRNGSVREWAETHGISDRIRLALPWKWGLLNRAMKGRW